MSIQILLNIQALISLNYNTVELLWVRRRKFLVVYYVDTLQITVESCLSRSDRTRPCPDNQNQLKNVLLFYIGKTTNFFSFFYYHIGLLFNRQIHFKKVSKASYSLKLKVYCAYDTKRN